MALGAKLKLDFVNGSCGKSVDNEDEVQCWVRADFMVRCWIINSMCSEVVEGFTYVQLSKELWGEIL